MSLSLSRFACPKRFEFLTEKYNDAIPKSLSMAEERVIWDAEFNPQPFVPPADLKPRNQSSTLNPDRSAVANPNNNPNPNPNPSHP